MMGRWAELVFGPFRASWRAGVAWGIGLVALVVSTVAFWPAFKGASGITEAMAQLPPALVQAFGLQGFGTPAGYLRGGLYELIVPLLMAAAGIMLANGSTAGEEDAGRLELFLAQPITRWALFTGRSLAIGCWLVVLALALLVSQLLSDAAFGLEIDTNRALATIVLCVLLGALASGLSLAVAGAVAKPTLVLSVGFGVVFASYLVAVLFPLSAVLAPWRHLSPWDWALGGDPLVNGAEAWRYAALAVPAVLLALAGAFAFGRRDARSA